MSPSISLHDGRWGFWFEASNNAAAPFIYAAIFSVSTSTCPPSPTCANLVDLMAAVDGIDFGQFLICTSGTSIPVGSAQWIVQGFADALPMPATVPTGAFAWAAKVAEVSLRLERGMLVERHRDVWSLVPGVDNVLIPAEKSTGLFLRSVTSGEGDVRVADQLVTIGAVKPARLVTGAMVALSDIASVCSDFSDAASCGSSQINATLGKVGQGLSLGFTFGLTDSPTVTTPSSGPSEKAFYPIFDAAGAASLTGLAVAFNVPFVGPTTLSFGSAPPTLSSAYRTVLGETILLTPPLTCFLGTYSDDGSHAFAPCGKWTSSLLRAGVSNFNLVCGLSGLETIALSPGDTFNFYQGHPAQIYASRQMQASIDTAPQLRWAPADMKGSTTAYVAPGAAHGTLSYAKQSQLLPLFNVDAGAGGLLPAADPGEWTLATPGDQCAFPLLPYAGLSNSLSAEQVNLITALEGTVIAKSREQIIVNTASAGGPMKPLVAVTPQGFVLTFGQDGLTSVQFAASADGTDAIAISLSPSSSWTTPLEEVLAEAQPFLVISMFDKACGATITPSLPMDGWKLDLNFADPLDAAAGRYQTILLVKAAVGGLSSYIGNPATWSQRAIFNDNTVDKNGEILSGFLKDYIAQTRTAYAGGTGVADFADFLKIVDNPAWTGVLVLNAPIDLVDCPTAIQAMLIGADYQGGAVCAHHVVASPARLSVTDQAAKAASSFDAVITYIRPGITLGEMARNEVGMLPVTGADQFLLLHLRAVFKNSLITHFQSAAALVITELFGEQIAGGSLDGGTTLGTNAVVVRGVMHRLADGTASYAFVAPPGAPSVFYLNSSVIDYVLVDKISTSIAHPQAEQTVVAFRLGGWMRLRCLETCDLLSYDALALEGMKVTMSYSVGKSPQAPTFVLDTADIAIAPGNASQSSGDAEPQGSMPAAHLYRDGSLVSQWPLRLSALVIPAAGQTPQGMGFQDVTMPDGLAGTGAAASGWFGLRFALPLGSRGMGGTAQLISAEFLLVWSPVASDDTAIPAAGAVLPYFRLLGPDGASLHLDIEGVIKVGVGEIRLRSSDPASATPQFILELQAIGLTVLSKTFPMNGGATVYLGGSGGKGQHRSLGWFGGAASEKVAS